MKYEVGAIERRREERLPLARFAIGWDGSAGLPLLSILS